MKTQLNLLNFLKKTVEFFDELNELIKDVDLSAKTSDDAMCDSGGKYDECYYMGVDYGSNDMGRKVLNLLNGYDFLSDENFEKLEKFEKENPL